MGHCRLSSCPVDRCHIAYHHCGVDVRAWTYVRFTKHSVLACIRNAKRCSPIVHLVVKRLDT